MRVVVLFLSYLLLCGGTSAMSALPRENRPVNEALPPLLREEGSFLKQVDVDPVAAAKIVRIVLRAEFNAVSEAKDVYLVDRFVERAWLPVIENVTFTVIDEAEFKKRDKAYFFKEPLLQDGLVRVDFGYGDDCSANGTSYYFQVAGTRVHRLTDKGGGWGAGYDKGSGEATRP